MRLLAMFGLLGALALPPLPGAAQEELASVATLHLADGATVALVQWKLTYEFVSWRSKEPVSSAKPQVRENPALILGRKTWPVKGDTLTLTHVESADMVRVASMSLKKGGDLKVEAPARELLAPDLDKDRIYQARSLDIAGKTLSGIDRSFCVASFSALVECGSTRSTRVVRIEFN